MRVMKARGSVRSFTSHGGRWPVVVPQAGAGAGSPSGTQNLLPSLGFVKVANTSWIISFIFFSPSGSHHPAMLCQVGGLVWSRCGGCGWFGHGSCQISSQGGVRLDLILVYFVLSTKRGAISGRGQQCHLGCGTLATCATPEGLEASSVSTSSKIKMLEGFHGACPHPGTALLGAGFPDFQEIAMFGEILTPPCCSPCLPAS